MEIDVIKSEKDEIQVKLSSLTSAEILREYLSKDDKVVLAAWKREHPSKNPLLIIKTKGKTTKKALSDAVSAIEKDTKKLVSEFKKLK